VRRPARGRKDTVARPDAGAQGLSMRTLVRFWFPLATSWMLMTAETPVVTAVAARMADPKLQLAAFGVAFSLVLMMESPIISMLTAANALARDRRSYRLVRRFMLGLSGILTLGMALFAATPLYDLVVLRLMGTPSDVAAIVRPVLLVMVPWPAAIAYRRFCQGIMIGQGHTRQVSYGTGLRLLTTLTVSLIGLAWGRLGGATVGACALGCAIVGEAVYAHLASRHAVRAIQRADALGEEGVHNLPALARFYVPLALTSMISLSTTPLLNFGMMRSLWPLESLAVWPVASGLLGMVRSFGYSLQEVIVALLNDASALKTMRRFAVLLAAGCLCLAAGIAFTPAGSWWLYRVAGLSPELVGFATSALRWAVLVPVLAVVQSWLRGIIVAGRATGAVAWATALNITVLILVLLGGVKLGRLAGASLAGVALTASQGVESLRLWLSVRSIRSRVEQTAATQCVTKETA